MTDKEKRVKELLSNRQFFGKIEVYSITGSDYVHINCQHNRLRDVQKTLRENGLEVFGGVRIANFGGSYHSLTCK